MSRSIRWTVIIGVLVFVLFAGVLFFSMSQQWEQVCEVCVTFKGRTACREGFGNTAEEAMRAATDKACGALASGMTDSIACQNTPPDRVTYQP